jgi:hypothetical protein
MFLGCLIDLELSYILDTLVSLIKSIARQFRINLLIIKHLGFNLVLLYHIQNV